MDLVPVFQEHACEEEGCDEWFYSWGLGLGNPFQESPVRFSSKLAESVELSMGGTALPLRWEPRSLDNGGGPEGPP